MRAMLLTLSLMLVACGADVQASQACRLDGYDLPADEACHRALPNSYPVTCAADQDPGPSAFVITVDDREVTCTCDPPLLGECHPSPFGGPCTADGREPLSTCRAIDGEVGWCITDDGRLPGTCREACVSGGCPDGGRPVSILDGADCYCRPST